MRIPRHKDVLLLIRPLNHDPNKPLQTLYNLLHLSQEPQPHVRRDLVVARAASVQLPAQRPDELAQAAFVRGVDVFVVWFYLKLITNQMRLIS